MVLIVVAVCARFGQMTKEENSRDGAVNKWMCLDKKQSPGNPTGKWFSPWVESLVQGKALQHEQKCLFILSAEPLGDRYWALAMLPKQEHFGKSVESREI